MPTATGLYGPLNRVIMFVLGQSGLQERGLFHREGFIYGLRQAKRKHCSN